MLFAVPAAGRRKRPRESNDDSVQVSHRDDTTVQRMSKKRKTTTHQIIFCYMLVYFLKICITFIKRTNQILITLKKKKELKMIRHLENGLIKQQNGNIQLCDTINNLQNDFVRLFLLRRFQSNKKNLFSTGYKRTPEMCGRPRILASKDDLS